MTISRPMRILPNLLRGAINGLLAQSERLIRVGTREPRHSPIFIVGAPRSGTTLLTQALINSVNVDYFSNLQCAMCGNPSLMASVLKSGGWRKQDFQSYYGTTSGLAGVSECGSFWYRFFPEDPDEQLPADEMTDSIDKLKTSIAAITRRTGRPLLLKNLQNVTRLPHLEYAFPDAVYINVLRNAVDNASSILLARQKSGGCINDWWSIKPHSWKELSSDGPVDQTLFQIVQIRKIIEAFFSGKDNPRLINVKYETFCEYPNEELERIVSKLVEFGCEVRKTRHIEERFRISSPLDRLRVELRDQLLSAVEAHPGIGY